MWYNVFTIPLLKSPFWFFLGKSTALIEVVGRNSGKLYYVPVSMVEVNGKLSTTSLRSRTWWRNLRGVEETRMCLRGKWTEYNVEVLEEENLARDAFQEYFQQHPRLARYYQVEMQGGTPDPVDVARVAKELVIVYFSI